MSALFLRHEGYLGAIGAYLKGVTEEDIDKYSWGESYLGSSGLTSPIEPTTNMVSVSHFVLCDFIVLCIVFIVLFVSLYYVLYSLYRLYHCIICAYLCMCHHICYVFFEG